MNFSIVVPTKNEEKTISKLLKALRRLYRNAEIVIVDASNDKTFNIAKGIALKDKKITLTKGEGYLSWDILNGIKIAKYDYVVVIDADFQHPINKIKDVVKKLDKCNIVICSGNRNVFPLKRKIIAYVAKMLANISLLFNKRKMCKDPMTGFFGLRKGILKNIDERRIVKEGWKILFDIIKQADFDYCYVNFHFKNRKVGFSKLRIEHVLYTIKSFLT